MKIHACQQRTPEWFALRTGRITATSFDTMANGKPATIETMCLKVAAEKITGQPSDEPYTNAAMENGTETEPKARASYETTVFVRIQEVGFLELDEYIGASPDGLCGEDGGIELKCPMPHTHLKYLTSGGKAWTNYRWQVQGALWITGRAWWDFVSFNPFFPPAKQVLIERVLPDLEAFKKLIDGAAHCRERIAEILKEFSGG